MEKSKLEEGQLRIEDIINPNIKEICHADYYGRMVNMDPDGFQGWKDFDEKKPIWQMKDGRYIPLSIMKDGHLVACYRMINSHIKDFETPMETTGECLGDLFRLAIETSVKVKWEEVLFNEANERGLVTKLYD